MIITGRKEQSDLRQKVIEVGVFLFIFFYRKLSCIDIFCTEYLVACVFPRS